MKTKALGVWVRILGFARIKFDYLNFKEHAIMIHPSKASAIRSKNGDVDQIFNVVGSSKDEW